MVAMENVNKLCSKHGYHSVTDETPCDIKYEKRSATIPMEHSIGDEREWAKACLLDLKDDQLQVKYITRYQCLQGRRRTTSGKCDNSRARTSSPKPPQTHKE